MASSSKHNPLKKITLRCSDNHLFDVEESVAMEFVSIKGFLEDKFKANDGGDEPIIIMLPLPNVTAAALTRMITYINKHLEFKVNSTPKAEVDSFKNEFAKAQSYDMLKELMLAANYMDVKYFLDFLIEVVANIIENKSVEYVRNNLCIENDFTPEEEEALRRENAWAFEGVDAD